MLVSKSMIDWEWERSMLRLTQVCGKFVSVSHMPHSISGKLSVRLDRGLRVARVGMVHVATSLTQVSLNGVRSETRLTYAQKNVVFCNKNISFLRCIWKTLRKHSFCGSISAGLLKSAVQRVYSTMQDLSGIVDDDHGDSSCDETEASQLCQQLFVLEEVQ